MNHHRMVAAFGVLALVSAAMMATASAAQAAVVHGCAGGDVCLYNSKAHYTNGNPDVVDDADEAGIFAGGTSDLIAVNNTLTLYSSQGYIEELYFHGVPVECEYHPYTDDVQHPNTIEDPAGDELTYAIDTGSTAASVNTVQLISQSYCDGS
jgi:hypothetical protein